MKITLKDIADRVDVSVSTVSRVLNQQQTAVEERKIEEIFRVSKELGYIKHLKDRNKTRNISEISIGCVLNNLKDKYHDPYFSEIIYGIEQELQANGLHLNFTLDSSEINEQSLPIMTNFNQTAIIIVGPMEQRYIKVLQKHAAFVISVGGDPLLDIDYVTVDLIKSAERAVDHLIHNGHSEIAYVGGNDTKDIGDILHEGRFIGYKNVLDSAGLTLKQEWIMNGQFTVHGGYEATKKLLKQDELPTAIFIASDRMSYGAYKAIQEKGLQVSKDIAIISFDDLEMSPFANPPLSTVRVHKEELGRVSIKLFIQRLVGEINLPLTTYLPTELIIRKSCGN